VIQGRRVVGYTPFGRMNTFSMMVPYLLRAHLAGQLDHFMLCLNFERDPQTNDWALIRNPAGELVEQQGEDHAYAHRLVDWYPELFSIYDCPGPATPGLAGQVPDQWMQGYRQPKQMNTGRFVWYMQDPDAIYVRLDDDIIWLHRNFFPALVGAKIGRPDLLAVFPVIWNNAVSSYVLQRNGHLDYRLGRVMPFATDNVGWLFPQFAEYVHSTLLHHLDHDHEDACLLPNPDAVDPVNPSGDPEPDIAQGRFRSPEWYELGWRQQFSVSSFAISGREYADLGGVLNYDEEEHWLTMHYTGIVQRSNGLFTGAQCAHLTFFTQSGFIWGTDIPHRYWRHSEELYKALPGDWQRGR
jgi:hypothetical protein